MPTSKTPSEKDDAAYEERQEAERAAREAEINARAELAASKVAREGKAVYEEFTETQASKETIFPRLQAEYPERERLREERKKEVMQATEGERDNNGDLSKAAKRMRSQKLQEIAQERLVDSINMNLAMTPTQFEKFFKEATLPDLTKKLAELQRLFPAMEQPLQLKAGSEADKPVNLTQAEPVFLDSFAPFSKAFEEASETHSRKKIRQRC